MRGPGACRSRGTERGVALAIGLVLLMVMSIVGIATLSGTRLNEKITSNAQQKAIGFEVAESALEAAWAQGDLLGRIKDADGALDGSVAAVLGEIGTTLSSGLDQSRDGATAVDVEASVTVRYCGEGPPTAGTELSADRSEGRFAAQLYDINGVAVVADSATRADHTLRGAWDRMRRGSTVTCTVPGI